MLGSQDPSTSSLQTDLESDEEDSAMLTAKDDTKWKKEQVGEQSTGRLASHNILKECPGPSSYARRNTQAASPASALLLFIDKFILEHIRKCTITKAHRQTENEEFCLTNKNCSHSLLSCTHQEYQVQMTCHIILCELKTGACP